MNMNEIQKKIDEIQKYINQIKSNLLLDIDNIGKNFNLSKLLEKKIEPKILSKFYFYLNSIGINNKYNDENFILFLISIMKYKKIEKNEFLYKLGEKNENLYLLLNGNLNVLKPIEKEVYMTDEEYILHLTNLLYNNQKELFKLIVKNNPGLYNVNSIYHFEIIMKEYFEKIKKLVHINKINNIKETMDINKKEKYIHINIFYEYFLEKLKKTIQLIDNELYNNRKNIYNNQKDIKEIIHESFPILIKFDSIEEEEQLKKYMKKPVNIYVFEEDNYDENIIKKGTFLNEYFTEFNSLKAGIYSYSDEQIILGYISKNYFIYDYINKYFITSLQKGTSNLTNNLIFKGINKNIFEKNYLKYFTLIKENKEEFLIKANTKPIYIYFLLKGLFEIYYKKEKISLVENKDIVGLTDFIDENTKLYKYSIKIVSDKIEYFKIKITDFIKILEINKNVYKSFKEFCETKNQIMEEKMNHFNLKHKIMIKNDYIKSFKSTNNIKQYHKNQKNCLLTKININDSLKKIPILTENYSCTKINKKNIYRNILLNNSMKNKIIKIEPILTNYNETNDKKIIYEKSNLRRFLQNNNEYINLKKKSPPILNISNSKIKKNDIQIYLNTQKNNNLLKNNYKLIKKPIILKKIYINKNIINNPNISSESRFIYNNIYNQYSQKNIRKIKKKILLQDINKNSLKLFNSQNNSRLNLKINPNSKN